jgi:thioredoxin reductase (NADPH)
VRIGPEAVRLSSVDATGDPHDRQFHRLPLEASRPGVFAVGDVRSGSIKRVASAVGEGAMAVRMVYERAWMGR